ncbi:hypothetical protein SynA1560_02150 [Synechococcus sp. A15-60]|nr:hypothetical protein SynA1560_02150 [Synechococcus sp. A15-60]
MLSSELIMPAIPRAAPLWLRLIPLFLRGEDERDSLID